MSVGRLLCAVLLAALAIAPAATAAADGIALVAPVNGSVLGAAADVGFQWTTTWSGGAEALIVASDARFADIVTVRSWSCAPTCATSARLGSLPAGTYYWGVGIELGAGVVHLSEPWSFTVAAPAKVRAPYLPPPRHKSKRRRHPKPS